MVNMGWLKSHDFEVKESPRMEECASKIQGAWRGRLTKDAPSFNSKRRNATTTIKHFVHNFVQQKKRYISKQKRQAISLERLSGELLARELLESCIYSFV
jgi:hypothetical protein